MCVGFRGKPRPGQFNGAYFMSCHTTVGKYSGQVGLGQSGWVGLGQLGQVGFGWVRSGLGQGQVMVGSGQVRTGWVGLSWVRLG